MDFGLEDNLDLKLENGEFVIQKNGEATTINAFFTDARVNEQRGYWLDIMSSEVWTYEQSRLTDNVARELTETAREIAKKLVEEELYTRVETEAYVSDSVMTLDIKCYNKSLVVVDRKFAI